MRSGSTISRKTPCATYSLPSGDCERTRHAPPGRRSISQESVVKPRGPHHCLMRSGSVQALKTRLRGASKTRVITSSRSASFSVGLFVFAVIVFLLRLQFLQIIVQTISHAA